MNPAQNAATPDLEALIRNLWIKTGSDGRIRTSVAEGAIRKAVVDHPTILDGYSHKPYPCFERPMTGAEITAKFERDEARIEELEAAVLDMRERCAAVAMDAWKAINGVMSNETRAAQKRVLDASRPLTTIRSILPATPNTEGA